MNYVKLGRTGIDISRICLGCMSYGGSNRGNHAWRPGEEESRPSSSVRSKPASISSTRRTAIRSAAMRKSSVARLPARD